MALTDVPQWYRDRGLGADWAGAVDAVERERDLRDRLRSEMLTEVVAGEHLIARDGDWALRDCERMTAVLVALAERVARIRESINHEGTLQ